MYRQFAPFYDRWHETDWYTKRLPFLLKTAGLSPGDAVYEGGCGAGHLTKALADAGLLVTATDRSAAMLAIAQQKRADRNISYYKEDLTRMPMRTGFQAFLFCLDVIQYLAPEDLLSLFGRVYASLPPGGFLVFDHLPEKILRWRAAMPPICYRSTEYQMVWKTKVSGNRARYTLDLFHRGRHMREIQKLWVYKKRVIRNLLLQSGDWQVQGYGDYRQKPMNTGAERFTWFAKKMGT